MNNAKPTLLITGATGFVGSHLVEMALAQGFEVWAAIRQSSSLRYLQDPRIHLIELAFADADALCQQVSAFKQSQNGEAWDYVVHAAGATKARSEAEFIRANADATRNLMDALLKADAKPRRFVLMSSLSAVPMRDGMPAGNEAETAYGRSKLMAEAIVKERLQEMDSVILRPTGVYGPREKDYFLMAKSIKQHTDFAVGFKPQEITFIYVRDLVEAILLAIEAKDVEGKAYFLSDGEVYHSRRFSDLLQQEMGNPWVLHIKAPLWFLKTICAISGTVSGWFGKTSTLNLDKYHILKQRNWQCDIEPARRDLGYHPEWPLERGVKETVKWYKENKWL